MRLDLTRPMLPSAEDKPIPSMTTPGAPPSQGATSMMSVLVRFLPPSAEVITTILLPAQLPQRYLEASPMILLPMPPRLSLAEGITTTSAPAQPTQLSPGAP